MTRTQAVLYLSPVPAAILAFIWYASPAGNNTTIYKQPVTTIHVTKLINDRIAPSMEAVTVVYKMPSVEIDNVAKTDQELAPCLLPRRVRSKVDGLCYLHKRLPELR